MKEDTTYGGLTISASLLQVREASGDAVRNPVSVLAVCADMATMAQEAVVVLSLNKRNRLIERRLVTLGIVDASLLHPREVFRGAIMDGANSIIIVHNHPSGDMSPSAEDLRITRQMVEAGKIIDIQVMDHCIIGRGPEGTAAVASIRESGAVSFA